MKKAIVTSFLFSLMLGLNAQNVGIGTINPTENFHVVGLRSLFENSYVGIGTGNAVSSYALFQINKNLNDWVGMYINAGVTGKPFYGYALNGVGKAYTQFNGNTSELEYFQSNGSTPDFLINGNTKAVFNTAFVGIGTSTPTTGFTGLALKSSANSFWGSYIDAGPTGTPFYGYALDGVATAYTTYSGPNSQFEYHHTTDATPDFLISNTRAAFPNSNFLGVGTSSPTNGFTGLTLKSTANSFYGSYIDVGPTGTPFYGYALNGIATAYTTFSGPNNQFEYHHTSDATPDFLISNTKAAFPNSNFLGIGTTTPTTGYTGLALKSNANSFWGSYIDAGPTGTPFYGYALNGNAVAYTTFSGPNSQFEYHHTTDATPDFLISNTTAAFPNTNFLGIGTSTPTTGFTGLSIKSSVNSYYGAYVDAGSSGTPFYGYALGGVATAYTTFSGPNNQFEYHHTTDATPDFSVSDTKVTFPIQTALTIGTSTPLNSFTGLTLKNNVNTYYGMYIDAGASGNPFYGYSLGGGVRAYTQINGATGNWELITTTNPALVVTPSGNMGVGVNPTQKLDVNGTIHASNLNGGATSLSTDASGNIIRTPSDARLKNDIVDISEALQKVLQMHGVTYTFKDANRFGKERQMGFLAQELEAIVPEAVSDGGEYKSVNYQVLTALLTEALKEQQKQIDQQKEINLSLKNEIDQLKILIGNMKK